MIGNTGTYLDSPYHRYADGPVGLRAGVFDLHLTNLGALPQQGARFTAVPPAIEGFGTFPVRAFAEIIQA